MDAVHRRDQAELIVSRKPAEHCADVVLRSALQRREIFAAAWRERQMALPGVAGGCRAPDQAAFLEIAQHAGQVAGIEIERAADLARRRRVPARDFVEDARLAERIGAVEESFAQYADLSRVEAVEAAHRGDALRGAVGPVFAAGVVTVQHIFSIFYI